MAISERTMFFNVNHSCGIDALLIKFCPDVVQAFHLLTLKFTLTAYQT
jgi:hypothetical protein